MKLRTRENEFRRVDSGADDAIGENFYDSFINNFNKLIECSGREKIALKKQAAAVEEEYSWIDSSSDKKDFVADTVRKYAGNKPVTPEYAFDSFYKKAEQTDKITKEAGGYFVWAGEEKISLSEERVNELMLKEGE